MSYEISSLNKISALSYWRYTRLKRCLLSGAFPSSVQSTFKAERLTTRPQTLGKIFHSAMEEYHRLESAGNLSPKTIRTGFNQVLEKYIAELTASGSIRTVGNPRQWQEITQIYMALPDLAERQKASAPAGKSETKTEQTLHSKDRLLFGQVDAYFIRPDGIDLVDYKSGPMLEGDSPKEDYANQLYFYAYLIHQSHGRYPRTLTLVGRDATAVQLQPSESRSEALANDMRAVLGQYNDLVDRSEPKESFAKPSPDNCIFCDARPICSTFWKKVNNLELPTWSQVATGIQASTFETSRQGGTSFLLNVEFSSLATKTLKVTRVFTGRYPEFQDRIGQRLICLNLRQPLPDNPSIVEATERTIIISPRGGDAPSR